MPLFSPQLMKRKEQLSTLVNIQTIELLKIKLSHKLPSKQNYLLSKTFTFDNSNSHCLEQIRFITLFFFEFELSRVNCSCSHFFSLAS